jgi:hypothetical protein
VLSSPRRPERTGRSALRGLVVVGLLLAVGRLAADPPKTPETPPRPAEPAPKIVRSLADLKRLPPGAVVVICKEEEVKDALRLVPQGLILSVEEYQALLDKIAALEGKLKPDKPIAPASCKISGRVETGAVHLTVQFGIRTTQANTFVALRCGQGIPTDARLDGHLPLLQFGDDGLTVLVEDAGDNHQLTLEMEVPLTARGVSDRGFELDLPRSAINSLELLLPETVKEVRLETDRDVRGKGRVLAVKPADGNHVRLEPETLGPTGRIDVSWKGAGPLNPGGPLLAADVRTEVRLDADSVTTDVRLTLKPRGQTAQWRLQLPPGATLLDSIALDDRIAAVEAPDPKNPKAPQITTVRLKQSSAEPLTLTFRIHQSPRPDGPIPVGPFLVPGAVQQQGTILVMAPPDLQVGYQLRGSPQAVVIPRDVSDDERRKEKSAVAAFRYWHLAQPEKPPAPPVPYLNLEVERARGVVTTKTAHVLRLTEQGWRLVTEIDVVPQRTLGVSSVLVKLPPGFNLDKEESTGAGQRLEFEGGQGDRLQVTLTPRRTEPFHIKLVGSYNPEGAGERPAWQAVLELPRPRQTDDAGGSVTVRLDLPDLELVAPRQGEQPDDRAWEGLTSGMREYTWKTTHAPEQVAVAWRPHRPEIVVATEANVKLNGRQGAVDCTLRFTGTQTPLPARPLLLWVPDGVEGVAFPDGGRVLPPEESQPTLKKAGFHPLSVELPGGGKPADRLRLSYFFPLAGAGKPGGQRFAVPLPVPEPATRSDATVRLWTAAGALPELVDGPWQETMDWGDGGDTLPALVLKGNRPDLPPVVRLHEAAAGDWPTVFLERALIRVAVADSGYQEYRASFLISQLRTDSLDVELPAAPAGLKLSVRVGSAERGWRAVSPASVEESRTGGRLLRLPMPEQFRTAGVLEIVYELPPGDNGTLQTTLAPPVLRGEGGRGPVRWRVSLPPDWVPLYGQSGSAAEQRWGWRGWLLAPRPALGDADLERWFLANSAVPPGAGSEGTGAEVPALVCWRSGLAPLTIHHVPQQGWLLLCSLLVLALGLGLYYLVPWASAPRRLFWVVLALLGLGTALTSLVWPSILAAVAYGCEPGLVVVLLVLAVQWLLHQRYRRRVVFMPGFKRAKAGSSLVRSDSHRSSQQKRGEPSTVDAVPQPASGNGPWAPAATAPPAEK